MRVAKWLVMLMLCSLPVGMSYAAESANVWGVITDSVLGTPIESVDVYIGAEYMISSDTGVYESSASPFQTTQTVGLVAEHADYTTYATVFTIDDVSDEKSFTMVHDPTYTPTNTPTATPTNTPTVTQTFTPTDTPTVTNTPTDTPTNTPTNTPTDTPTPTITPTNTPTATNTPTPTITPTFTVTNTPAVAETPSTASGLTKVIPKDLSGYSVYSQTYAAMVYLADISPASDSVSRAIVVDLIGGSFGHSVGATINVVGVEAYGVMPVSATAEMRLGVCRSVVAATGDVEWFMFKPQVSDTAAASRTFVVSTNCVVYPTYLVGSKSLAQDWAGSTYGQLMSADGDTTASCGTGDIVVELKGQLETFSILVWYTTR